MTDRLTARPSMIRRTVTATVGLIIGWTVAENVVMSAAFALTGR